MAGLIHYLPKQRHPDFLVVRRHGGDEPARNICSYKLNLGEEGGQLALCGFDVIGQFFQSVPGNIRGRTPLTADKLFI